MTKRYTVAVDLVFHGAVTLDAENKEDAIKIITDHVHACQPTVTSEDNPSIVDYEFNNQADTIVIKGGN